VLPAPPPPPAAPSKYIYTQGKVKTEGKTSRHLVFQVVQKVDNAIQWINLYPLDNAIVFPNTYPLLSDLSGG